ncbi:MAG: GNAT family N-acetyltransferase [Solirubrobacterales bacterium]
MTSCEWRTSRLLARRPDASSQSAYRSLLLDPAVGEWLRPPPLEPFDDAAILGMLSKDERHWSEHGFGPCALIEEATGSMVGRGGLQRTELDGALAVELPWTIDSAHWGQGLATEAASGALEWARSLDLSEVVALIMAGNAASRRVAEKIGLRRDGETQHAGLPHLVYKRSLGR